MQREQRKTSSVQALNHNTDSAACFYSDCSKRWPALLRGAGPSFSFKAPSAFNMRLFALDCGRKSQRTLRWMSRSEGELHVN